MATFSFFFIWGGAAAPTRVCVEGERERRGGREACVRERGVREGRRRKMDEDSAGASLAGGGLLLLLPARAGARTPPLNPPAPGIPPFAARHFATHSIAG
jgi:hypothetical protein